ncbi:MAG TPA: ATP-binding protein [Saprospiraceae bacterium]|nr:ATP-binding protein [Saprospiraceae bacterium]HPI05809.1 ATP-binding protein [Saprospiraceae bacterium]
MGKNIPEFLSGGGEMGERIRNYDWSTTPLGPPEQWQQSLKTCVRIMLTSSQPIWIGWGKELIKLYNDPYKAIVGGKHPQALGQPASVVWKDIWKDIASMLERVMDQNEGTYVESQLLIMERNGYPEETYYTFSYTPIPGDEGGTAGMFCANSDDTEKIISERQLRTLTQMGKALIGAQTVEEVYRNAIHSLKGNPEDFPFAAIYEVEQNGKHLILAGETAPLPRNFFPDDVCLERDSDKFPYLSTAIEGKKPLVFSGMLETFGPLPCGHWQQQPHSLMVIPVFMTTRKNPVAIVQVGFNPYRKADEKYLNYFELIADQIATGTNNVLNFEAERKRNEALEELDRSKTVFFSNISHEFRTPITLMLGPLEELLQKNVSGLANEERQHLETTHRNALRLLKLVNTLLDFSRIESGRQQASYVRTNISTFTENLASNFRSVMEKAGLEFSVQAEKIARPVYVDRQMWEKIVFNLLSNAFKFTLEGKITVRISAEEEFFSMTVEDTGIGIPENELPHMFERFHRIQNAVGRTYEGTGIGLSLIMELVKMHGGAIGVESRVGSGTKFIVTIPYGKSHLPEDLVFETENVPEADISSAYLQEAGFIMDVSNDRPQPSESQKNSREGAVLIVDDNADMRQHLESIVGKVYKTVKAVNGAEALKVMNREKIALVLSDIMMPVMDGVELLKHLKENSATAEIPVVLITARAGEESRIEGFETGADDYLVKPFSARELLARIKVQMELSKKRNAVNRQLTDLFVQAPTAIVILKGPEFVFELANDRALEIISRTKMEVSGRKAAEVMPELAAQGFIQLMEQVYYSGERVVVEETPLRYTSHGQEVSIFVKFVFQPLIDEDGSISGIMILGDDVSPQVLARKKIEENEENLEKQVAQRTGELLKANKELESFNYVASHDLQEPLRKIQTFINLVEKNKDNPEATEKYFQKINQSTQRMRDLIQSILVYSRLSKTGEELVDTDLNKILSDVTSDLELLMEEKGATIQSDHLPVIKANALQMHQLFSNLISNSIKFSRQSPMIRIQAQVVAGKEMNLADKINPQQQYLRLTFRDNGIGFEPRFKEQIFNLFQRLHGKDEFSGTGIGLSIVKKIVEQHNGFIEADSQPGEGAVFNIWIPN